MNGAYWGLTALDIMGKLDTVDVNEVVPWIMSCQHESGCSFTSIIIISVNITFMPCNLSEFWFFVIFFYTYYADIFLSYVRCVLF
jgi:hypothetical protein